MSGVKGCRGGTHGNLHLWEVSCYSRGRREKRGVVRPGSRDRPGRNPRVHPRRKVMALPVSELRIGIPLALRGDAEADILAVVARLVVDGDDGAFRYASLDLCVFIDD